MKVNIQRYGYLYSINIYGHIFGHTQKCLHHNITGQDKKLYTHTTFNQFYRHILRCDRITLEYIIFETLEVTIISIFTVFVYLIDNIRKLRHL